MRLMTKSGRKELRPYDRRLMMLSGRNELRPYNNR